MTKKAKVEKQFIAGTTVLTVNSRDGLTQRLVRFKIGARAQYDEMLTHDPNVLYFCQDTGHLFVGDVNYNSVDSIESLLNVISYTIDEATADHKTIPTVKAVMDYVIAKISGITGGIVYAGVIDATNPTANPKWTNAKLGYYFRVNVAGVISGVKLGVGDTIIINKNVTGTPTKEDMDVIPFTIDEIGDLTELHTEAKDNLVHAINELADNQCRWTGI